MKWIRCLLLLVVCIFFNTNAQSLGILPVEFRAIDLSQPRPASVLLSKKYRTEFKLLLSPDKTKLEVRFGSTRQAFKINTRLLRELPDNARLVVARDFNFDGLTDFAVAQDFNASLYFDDIYVFNPASHGFKLMPAPDRVTDGLWCNPEPDWKNKLILTDCSHGRSRDYRVWNSKPFLYRSNETVALAGFPLPETSVVLVKIFTRSGKLKQSFLTTQYRSTKPVMRHIPVARVELYRKPLEPSKTSGFLVKGDWVQVLAIVENQSGQWLRIKYYSQRLGWITRWTMI
jgi:GW (Gly-Tryp) dipeptide domain